MLSTNVLPVPIIVLLIVHVMTLTMDSNVSVMLVSLVLTIMVFLHVLTRTSATPMNITVIQMLLVRIMLVDFHANVILVSKAVELWVIVTTSMNVMTVAPAMAMQSVPTRMEVILVFVNLDIKVMESIAPMLMNVMPLAPLITTVISIQFATIMMDRLHVPVTKDLHKINLMDLVKTLMNVLMPVSTIVMIMGCARIPMVRTNVHVSLVGQVMEPVVLISMNVMQIKMNVLYKQHVSTMLVLTIANVTLVTRVKMVLAELVMISMNVPLVVMIVTMLPFVQTYLVRGAVIAVLGMTVTELPVSIKMNV